MQRRLQGLHCQPQHRVPVDLNKSYLSVKAVQAELNIHTLSKLSDQLHEIIITPAVARVNIWAMEDPTLVPMEA